ncbi:MAG: SUMF1/EgtB/PvdO family nonheme iron enzyme [Steroidobacteraceae bacterium]
MRRWFLSYHSPDQALAERLKAAIERKDVATRVFFAPTHLRAGGCWSAQLAQEIAEANGFILLVGESGIGKWQVPEYYEAHDRWVNAPTEFPLVVVLLEGQTAPGLPFLRQLHWIITPDPVSEKDVARLFDAAAGGGSSPGDLWRYTSPYRGLAAMEEKDSDYFIGRERETIDILSALATAPERLPLLIGNSGVGKSSLAQAGVLAALKRQAWPDEATEKTNWPSAFADSRRWCFLTLRPGGDPLRALVEAFLRIWQFDPTDPRRETRQIEWIENLREGRNTLAGLFDATEARLEELCQPKPPGFLLYVDQGEELYARAEERARHRFSELLAQALVEPRLRAMMSLRADFFGDLQKDRSLFGVHRHINVPPLVERELGRVVSRPAELLSAKFETDHLAGDITRRAAEESTADAGALPLLSYLLDDMWQRMVERGDGVLRLGAQSIELGRVLVQRADAFLARNPKSEETLRRIFTLKLATVREDGEPTRRRAFRSEFSDEQWRLVSDLADHPNRLLVAATPEASETYAEVAHEAIFRRWDKLREWIAAEREFLAWRSGLEAARRAWQATPEASKHDALLMGAALMQAQNWFAQRAEDLPKVDQEFIALSIERERKTQARARRVQALIYVLLVGVIGSLVGIIEKEAIREQLHWFTVMRPYRVANFDRHVLKPEAERALKPLTSFRECAKDCPEMIVIPAGGFTMGSPTTERGRYGDEGPQHRVTIAKPFAVSKFDVTFADWDACVSVGGCPIATDTGFGRDIKPVINVSWDDAQTYVAWLSKMTGQPYRLLTEAEWEYAARAGTTTAYYWGDDIGKGNANCKGCGSQWDAKQTSPVGSFPANPFGLYDMAGNVFQWVQDCHHAGYDEAPIDGSAWTSGDCSNRVVRSSSWSSSPDTLRSAYRNWDSTDGRLDYLGFRVGRTLTP